MSTINIIMLFFDRDFSRQPYANQTLEWSGSDTIKNFRRHQPNPYTRHSITYRFNEHGFRSDQFESNDHSMIFLGCSFTEGVGLPLEETYSSIIHQEIQQRLGRNIPYWNLGMGGCGLDSIVRCYYNFYRQLKPRVVVALFPCYRLEHKILGGWKFVLSNFDDEKIFTKNPYLTDPTVVQYSIEKNLAMLDLMLAENDTLLIWDYWEPIPNNYSKLDLSRLEYFKHYAKSWPQQGISSTARDGFHPGKLIHEYFAKNVLLKYSHMICERLG
jgi:hypothetical protein